MSNLLKLSLIIVLVTAVSNTQANNTKQKNKAEQELIIIMEPGSCPHAPECSIPTENEEEEQ